MLALVLAAHSLGCEGGGHACPGFVQVICVSSQAEADRLNGLSQAQCGPSYEVCEPQDASYTTPPDALPSLVGDGAIADGHADAGDSASDAQGDVASDAAGD